MDKTSKKIPLKRRPKSNYYKGVRKSKLRKRKLLKPNEIKVEGYNLRDRENLHHRQEPSEDERDCIDIGQPTIDWNESHDFDMQEEAQYPQDSFNPPNSSIGFIITDVQTIKTEPPENNGYVIENLMNAKLVTLNEPQQVNPSASTTTKVKPEVGDGSPDGPDRSGPKVQFDNRNVSKNSSENTNSSKTALENEVPTTKSVYENQNAAPQAVSLNVPVERDLNSLKFSNGDNSTHPAKVPFENGDIRLNSPRAYFEGENASSNSSPDKLNPRHLQFKTHKAADILRKHCSAKSNDKADFSLNSQPSCSYTTRPSTSMASTSNSSNPAHGRLSLTSSNQLDSFHRHLMNIISEGNYTSCQIFSIVDTEFFWKSLPQKPSAARSGNDHLSLLLCANASGDFKLNPLIVHPTTVSYNLNCLATHRLPAFWRSSPDGSITESLFVEYFACCVVQKIKEYLRTMRLPEKALVIIDNKLCYPPYLNFLGDDIKLVFIPRECSILQPLDHKVIHLIKLRYLISSLRHHHAALSLRKCQTFSDLLSSFTIRDAIFLLSAAWESVMQNTLTSSWSKLWSKSTNLDGVPSLHSEIKEVMKLSATFPFEEISHFDVQSVYHYLELRRDQLLQTWNNVEENRQQNTDAPIVSSVNSFNTYSLEASQVLQRAISVISKDPDVQRSSVHLSQLRKIRDAYQGMYFHWSQMDPDMKRCFIPNGDDS